MEEKQKTAGELRREALLHQPKNGYGRLSAQGEADIKPHCEDCKKFLDAGRTEWECVTEAVHPAEAKDFKPFTRGMAISPDDKLYRINRGKALILAMVGIRPFSGDVNIGAAHIDFPRLDLKPNPLYEGAELAFFKIHYYGGIRRYQWVTIPLELRGVVVLKGDSTVVVSIDGAPEDLQFTIDDLLPHLGVKQSKKPPGGAIPGGSLNLPTGSRSFRDDKGSDRAKLAVMNYLDQKYRIAKENFISAELEAVPVFKAADIDFDHSLIGACGHDDRACGFACLVALPALGIPDKTAVYMLVDKEKINSADVSDIRSITFDTFVSDLHDVQRAPLKACYEKPFCLSTDVTTAYDPNFAEVCEKRNSTWVNYGIGPCEYTDSRGKSGASDVSVEAVAHIRRASGETGMVWQMTELGKMDTGGGGTVTCYMAECDTDTIDAGVPMPSMHIPFETVDKLNCYIAHRRIKTFYEKQICVGDERTCGMTAGAFALR